MATAAAFAAQASDIRGPESFRSKANYALLRSIDKHPEQWLGHQDVDQQKQAFAVLAATEAFYQCPSQKVGGGVFRISGPTLRRHASELMSEHKAKGIVGTLDNLLKLGSRAIDCTYLRYIHYIDDQESAQGTQQVQRSLSSSTATSLTEHDDVAASRSAKGVARPKCDPPADDEVGRPSDAETDFNVGIDTPTASTFEPHRADATEDDHLQNQKEGRRHFALAARTLLHHIDTHCIGVTPSPVPAHVYRDVASTYAIFYCDQAEQKIMQRTPKKVFDLAWQVLRTCFGKNTKYRSEHLIARGSELIPKEYLQRIAYGTEPVAPRLSRVDIDHASEPPRSPRRPSVSSLSSDSSEEVIPRYPPRSERGPKEKTRFLHSEMPAPQPSISCREQGHTPVEPAAATPFQLVLANLDKHMDKDPRRSMPTSGPFADSTDFSLDESELADALEGVKMELESVICQHLQKSDLDLDAPTRLELVEPGLHLSRLYRAIHGAGIQGEQMADFAEKSTASTVMLALAGAFVHTEILTVGSNMPLPQDIIKDLRAVLGRVTGPFESELRNFGTDLDTILRRAFAEDVRRNSRDDVALSDRAHTLALSLACSLGRQLRAMQPVDMLFEAASEQASTMRLSQKLGHIIRRALTLRKQLHAAREIYSSLWYLPGVPFDGYFMEATQGSGSTVVATVFPGLQVQRNDETEPEAVCKAQVMLA